VTQHRLELEDRGGAVVAHLAGEVDAANATAVKVELLRRADGGTLVLDLAGTEYLDSAGIAMLETLRRSTDLRVVFDPMSIVGRAVTIVGFDQVLAIYPSVDDALAATSA
jgi:anti-anti-sigma factor